MLAVMAATLMVPAQALAHDQWKGAYRKWPWKAGRSIVLTTLPGDCPHCPAMQPSSSWKAIDAAMNYETVFAISPGKIERYEPSGGGAGKYMRILDDDGTYITYEHLSKALLTSGRVVAGQPIAVSGCTGNCTGPHLHFERTDAPSFTAKALKLTRISGHGGSGEPLRYTEYTSDNAGVSYTAGGSGLASMRRSYNKAGGYKGFGVTSNVGEIWSPCRNDDIKGTWFRYGCSPNPDVAGSVQTYLGPDGEPRALTHEKGSDNTYRLRRAILAAYTEKFYGHDWVYWMGYPRGNRQLTSTDVFHQRFQFGYVNFDRARCEVHLYVHGTWWNSYPFCD
jgi:hypothetical protein